MNNLRTGVEDILIAVVDGPQGFSRCIKRIPEPHQTALSSFGAIA